jgi:SAM-dependent methyltransferase
MTPEAILRPGGGVRRAPGTSAVNVEARRTLASSYDEVADEYVARIFDELRGKPLDRELLDRFADAVRDAGPVCDVGCGPGHVARYLHDRGVDVSGVDLSEGMLERARRLNPGVAFRRGDLAALGVEDGTWTGIVAFYSIIHVPRGEVVDALRELERTLRPGGILLIAFHVGEETLHLDELWGHPVALDFFFFTAEEMTGYLRSAGFRVEEVIERDPYPDLEYPSRRAYIRARKAEGRPDPAEERRRG